MTNKQNIPKDYKIAVRYIPKEVSGICWVKLNIFHLELSLKDLALKFGNISSNKVDIETFVQILQEMRYHMRHGLESWMLEFACHYRTEVWPTGTYFKFVEDFFNMANSSREAENCEPPACPTSTNTAVTSSTNAAVTSFTTASVFHQFSSDGAFLPRVVESSLMSLLLVPVIAVLFVLLWKVRCRGSGRQTERSAESPALSPAEETSVSPSHVEMPKRKRLNIRTV